MNSRSVNKAAVSFAVVFATAFAVYGQETKHSYDLPAAAAYEIENPSGRVNVLAVGENESPGITASSSDAFRRGAVSVGSKKGTIRILVATDRESDRIDVEVRVPERSAVKVIARDAQVTIAGDLSEIRVETGTGTVYTDIPLENLKYKFLWTASRPRYLSDIALEDVEEKNAGKFVIEGSRNEVPAAEAFPEESETDPPPVSQGLIDLEVRTARGIVLVNVDPSQVPTNLVERPLTEAAKSIVRGGDLLLIEAIRRASPKYFGEYASTLPPRQAEPSLGASKGVNSPGRSTRRVATVQVFDENNRAVHGLTAADFEVTERGVAREIHSVEPSTAPFNLVLLLDVSGSVQNYVDFIRKAARRFVNTVDPGDRVAIVVFNDDSKTLSGFTTDRFLLSESLDTFDAGGGTAYYDSIGYVLSDTLPPLKGERTAVVILSDGEDNRSFLPFSSLLGSVEESGALIYPLYVPAGLVGKDSDTGSNISADPLRDRYLSIELTSRAQEEGERLAKVSGGVFYPISRLSELQKAYDDIVLQLRTAYSITYSSELSEADAGSPRARLRVRVGRPNTFVKLGSVTVAGR